MRKVIKRDGTEQEFDFNKIINAIGKSIGEKDFIKWVNDVGEFKGKDIVESLKQALEDKFSNNTNNLSVEEIQDIVERYLMIYKYYDSAKRYILYREEHRKIRERDYVILRKMKDKLEAKNIENQNANVDEMSFGGRIGEASRVALKEIALSDYMSKMARENHLNNEIYIHDLDSYAIGMHNCLSIPFDDLLSKGFNTRQTDVRPANSINTAFQLVAVIFQLQSLQQFGGVSATHLDWTMVPYVRKSFYKHYLDGYKYILKKDINITFDANKEITTYENNDAYNYALDMTIKELNQAAEGLFHNLNTLQSRSGNQLPFTSINFGTCTLKEGQLVIDALLNASINGVGKFGRTPIFPCSIFQCMKGVNRSPEDPNYYLFQKALKSTAQRLYPNYVNVDWSVNKGYDKSNPLTYCSTMGCRTYNGFDINGLEQQKDGRGNICPVTIILPTLAAEIVIDKKSINAIDDFISLLDKKIHEAKDMLLERYDWICKQPIESAKFMYENNTMAGFDGKSIESAMKHGTLAIGQLGLAECLQILIGEDQTSKNGMILAKRIENLFKTRCSEFKQKYSLNFGVYYTPAENLCYTAMKKFQERYGKIKNVSDREYFTNSMHVPVWKEINPFDKIDIESELTGYSNAGCITYVELPSTAKNNIEALEALVNYAMNKDIPYFAINVPNDTCMNCGYTDEIGATCPKCGSTNIQRLRRVTGYLTGDYKSAFNHGKQCEVKDRVKHVNN